MIAMPGLQIRATDLKVFVKVHDRHGRFAMFKRLAQLAALIAALAAFGPPAFAQGSLSDTYSGEELVESGREFFGSAAQGLASVVERAVSQYGQPNGYVL